jgi:hypothetical protein
MVIHLRPTVLRSGEDDGSAGIDGVARGVVETKAGMRFDPKAFPSGVSSALRLGSFEDCLIPGTEVQRQSENRGDLLALIPQALRGSHHASSNRIGVARDEDTSKVLRDVETFGITMDNQ